MLVQVHSLVVLPLCSSCDLVNQSPIGTCYLLALETPLLTLATVIMQLKDLAKHADPILRNGSICDLPTKVLDILNLMVSV